MRSIRNHAVFDLRHARHQRVKRRAHQQDCQGQLPGCSPVRGPFQQSMQQPTQGRGGADREKRPGLQVEFKHSVHPPDIAAQYDHFHKQGHEQASAHQEQNKAL